MRRPGKSQPRNADGETVDVCQYPRCRKTDICCAIPDPAGDHEPAPVCDDHFDAWFQTCRDPAARAVFVFKLWPTRGAR